MISSIYTPSEPVTQVQIWLRKLAQREGIHPLPAVDGIYSENTEAAVRRFQEMHGLPVTGVVDFATWNAIQAAYEPANACSGRPEPLYVRCPELCADSPNSCGSYVFIVQAMLNTLSPHYGNFSPIAYTGEYDDETRSHICSFQRCSGLPDAGRLDRLTWNALASLYNACQGQIPLDWQRGEL